MNSQIVTVNLVPGLSTPAVIRVSQYDVGRPLTIRVFDGTGAASFGASVTATIVGTKPSGLGFTETGTIAGNTVTLNTTLAMTQERGMIPVEIRFTQTGENIGTANFIIAVEPSPHPDGTTDGTQETMANLETRLQGEIDALDSRIDAIEGDQSIIDDIDALDARVTALEQGGSGLSQTEKNLILTLFSKAAYAESDADVAYEQLESLWATTDKTVTYNLSHVTSSNRATTVAQGASYTTTLTLDTDYTLETIIVKMGGVDITATAYSSGTISISSVTGNIVITASAVLVAESITAVYTQSGAVYTTDSLDSLKPDLEVTANYSGGSSEVVTDYTLSGTLTTGTSTITVEYGGLTTTFNVTVSAQPGMDWSSGVPYTVDWGEGGYKLDSSGAVITSGNASDHVSSFLECRGASAIICSKTPTPLFLYFYDESKAYLQSVTVHTDIESVPPNPVPRNAYYCRLVERKTDPTDISITPYLYPKLTESTVYELNTYYVMDYNGGTESTMATSLDGLCFSAKTLQTSMYARSFVYFKDAEHTTFSNAIRQNNATEISIPEGTYYISLYPGTDTANSNNPWVKFTS